MLRRCLSVVASRHGQILNRTDLAAPLGVPVPAISEWLPVLEITGQIILVPPCQENFGKRLLKSPKVCLLDSGAACHLLGIRTQAGLARSPSFGALFEGFVAAEVLKHEANLGRRRELYFFRDQQGLEVDFLFPGESGGLWMVEGKTSKTVQPAMARPLQSLRRAMRQHEPVRAAIIHPGAATPLPIRTVAPGIGALDLRELLEALEREAPRRRRRREASGAITAPLFPPGAGGPLARIPPMPLSPGVSAASPDAAAGEPAADEGNESSELCFQFGQPAFGSLNPVPNLLDPLPFSADPCLHAFPVSIGTGRALHLLKARKVAFAAFQRAPQLFQLVFQPRDLLPDTIRPGLALRRARLPLCLFLAAIFLEQLPAVLFSLPPGCLQRTGRLAESLDSLGPVPAKQAVSLPRVASPALLQHPGAFLQRRLPAIQGAQPRIGDCICDDGKTAGPESHDALIVTGKGRCRRGA